MKELVEQAREVLEPLKELLTNELVSGVVKGLAVLVIGLFLASLARRTIRRLTVRRLSAQHSMLSGRLIYWGIVGLVVVSILKNLGVDLSVLLGAAGLLTVAVGFAAQTSASNLICGLFLIGERAFEVGDQIQVSGTTGEVLSIDLLSVKLRTFDNRLVRLPNETLLKTEIVNLTHFPIRRVDVFLGVAYKERVAEVRKVLERVAAENPRCLDEPKPLFLFRGFGESSLDLQFSAWCTRESFYAFKTELHVEIKEALDVAGIEIPFPHRTLYAGSVTEPMPVRLVEPPSGEPPSGDPPSGVPEG